MLTYDPGLRSKDTHAQEAGPSAHTREHTLTLTNRAIRSIACNIPAAAFTLSPVRCTVVASRQSMPIEERACPQRLYAAPHLHALGRRHQQALAI